MPRRVFISFQKRDRYAKELLKTQAENKRINLEFNDRSQNHAFNNSWKNRMKSRINETSATVVMIGKDTYKSKAVNWEIEQSRKVGNKIIGVQTNPGKHHRLPPTMKKNEEIKRWKIENISNRLRKRK